MKKPIYLPLLIFLSLSACNEPESPIEEPVLDSNVTELNVVLAGELLPSKGKMKSKSYFYSNLNKADFVTDYFYDKTGNPILKVSQNNAGIPSAYLLNYFDSKGLITSGKAFQVGEFGLTFFNTRKYEYNAAGLLARELRGSEMAFTNWVQNTYDERGRIKSTFGRVKGEGDFAEFFYSDNSHKINEEHFYYDRSTGAPYYFLVYEYDLAGNLIAKKPSGQTGLGDSFMSFKYNDQNQLVEETLYSLQFGQQVKSRWTYTYYE
jgi:hypothetical protein